MEQKKLHRIAFALAFFLSHSSICFATQAEEAIKEPITIHSSTYGPTLNTDSLLVLATKLRPSEDISSYQMMVALYKTNPNAFYAENMNSLKTGTQLKIPAESLIREVSPQEARNLYSQHNLAWKERKEQSKKVTESENNTVAPVSLDTKDTQEVLALPFRVEEESKANAALKKPEAEKKTAQSKASTPATDTTPMLIALSTDVQSLTATIEGLSSQLVNNQEELKDLRQEVNQLRKEAFSSGVIASLPDDGGNNNLPYLLSGLFFGISILFGLGLWGFMRYRKTTIKPASKIKPEIKQDKQTPVASAQPQEKIRLTPLLQGYDFQEEQVIHQEEMNKEESVLNKLDLASAYIEMGEHEEAAIILQEILEEGNNTQRNEAKNLLSKIEMVI